MLKIITKFKCIIGLYMFLPLVVIICCLEGTPVFLDPRVQEALGLSMAICVFLSFCSPRLLGLKWLLMDQLTQVVHICSDIKTGNYNYFSLPNEPNDDSGENEMIALMRDMNWMIHQIEFRETELENRVKIRTRELEESNAALLKAKNAAKASAKAKNEFFTTMSHEIRTPMNAIIGMSELAMNQNRNAPLDEYLSIIHSSSTALLGIINDILDFSKMDAGKLVPEKIPVQMGKLFEEICDMFKGQMADLDVEFIMDIDPSVARVHYSDPLRLRQVLTNLISNAVKFTRKGEICVRVRALKTDKSEQKLEFSVQDTGIGIEKASLDKLFKPFSQADGSTTRKFGGTGLGLAISQKMVDLMGGKIIVTSQHGRGSCFSFILTLKIARDLNPPVPVLPGHIQGKTVLVAAKNETTEKVVCRFLRDFGLAPVIHGDPPPKKDGTEDNLPIGLAIVDTALSAPKLSKTTQIVATHDIPVITMGTRPMEKKTSPMARPDRFLQKPVKQSLLFDTLMEIFNGHPAPAEAITDHKPHSAQVLNTRLNILVVEDNGINQKLALEIFKSKGIDPVMAESGAQALELISKQAFHAVFMDIQMPEMNGYQVTRKIRKMEKARDLPVIAMTANAMASDRKKGRLAGMTAYITKPVCPEKLFDTLEACLDIPIRAPEPALSPAEPRRQADMTNQGLAPDLDLPGIDVNQALGRIRGNRDLLFELILEFGTDHGDLVARIRDLMQKQDKKPLLEEVHKLKGLARNLSANDLGQSIAAFEKAVRALPRRFAQDEPHLEALLLKIQNAMQPILETVKMLDRTITNTSKTASGTKKLPRNILDMTEELKKLISQNSLRAKEVSKQLSDLLCPTTCKEEALCIERHIKRYDFKKADSAFKALETKIRSGLAKAC